MDYHVLGDAVWVRTAPVLYLLCADDTMKLIPLGSPEDFSLSQPAFVQVCGLATNINKDNATFEVAVEQYISATRSAECFPTRCLIPDTPLQAHPQQRKVCLCDCFLAGVERDDDYTVKHFLLDIDQVVFLGQQLHSASAPKAEQSPNKIGKLKPLQSLSF